MADMKPKKTAADRLAELKKRQAQLQAQIAREENRAKEQARKDDTRCKIILGGALLADAAHHPDTAQFLRALLERAVTTERDKEFLAAMLPHYALKS
jgi:uncharacterized protein (DUF305 family)